MTDFFKDQVNLAITLMRSRGWEIVVSEDDKSKPLKSGGLGKIVRVESATCFETGDTTKDLVMKIPETGHSDTLKAEADFWMSDAGQKLKTHNYVIAPHMICEVCALFPMWEDGNLEEFMSDFNKIGGPYFENAHEHVLQVVVFNLLSVLELVTALGYQHRDVKPSNIMVKKSRDGGLSRLGLIDWGSVAPIGTKGLIGTTITFQAPEMVLGLGCSSTSDLYSACLIFVSMTVGFHNIMKPSKNERVTVGDLAIRNLCMEMRMFRVGRHEMCWVKEHIKNMSVSQITQRVVRDHNENMLLGWPNNKTHIVHKLHGRHMQRFMELILDSLAVIPENRKSVRDLKEDLQIYGFIGIVCLFKMKQVSLWPSEKPSEHPSKHRNFSIINSFAGAALCAMIWRKYPRKDKHFFGSLFEMWGRSTVASWIARMLWSGNPGDEAWPETPFLMDINPTVSLFSDAAFRAVANWAELSSTDMPDAKLTKEEFGHKLTLFCHDDTKFVVDVCA